ncbi:MAG: SpoIIE family protein phosphatase [Clostridia bacterium]|nr:SpoIIE family protein phosphatase [Clostridia bacterium]
MVYDKDLNDGDIIIMCSDGILESNIEYENKEIWIKNLLEEIETDNVQKIANILLSQSIDNGVGIAKDDMTVIAVKIKKA